MIKNVHFLHLSGYAASIFFLKTFAFSLYIWISHLFFNIKEEDLLSTITELFRRNEFYIVTFSAFCYAIGLFLKNIENFCVFKIPFSISFYFTQGFIQAVKYVFSLLVSLLCLGQLKVLGIFGWAGYLPQALFRFALQLICIVTFCICETYILSQISQKLKGFSAFCFIYFFYVVTKFLQFPLGWSYIWISFIFALFFFLKRKTGIYFFAGFLSAFWIILQPLFGIPLFNQSLDGFMPILLKPFWLIQNQDALNTYGFQALFLLECLRIILFEKKDVKTQWNWKFLGLGKS